MLSMHARQKFLGLPVMVHLVDLILKVLFLLWSFLQIRMQGLGSFIARAMEPFCMAKSRVAYGHL